MSSLVVDFGSNFTKCGFSGYNKPLFTFPSVVGRGKPTFFLGYDAKDCYIGNEVDDIVDSLKLKNPIRRGNICNFDDFEEVCRYVFNRVKVSSKETPILLTEPALNPQRNREKMTSLMFESFCIPHCYLGKQGVLSLYSLPQQRNGNNNSNSTTGFVLESGGGVSYVIPVYEGLAISHAIMKMDLGGEDITNYLEKSIENHFPFEYSKFHPREITRIAKEMKEKICFVSSSSTATKMMMTQEEKGGFRLPDDSILFIGKERFKAPELFFNPSSLLGRAGIHEIAFESIQKCENELQIQMLQNIVFSGGSTLFDGFSERFTEELNQLNEKKNKEVAKVINSYYNEDSSSLEIKKKKRMLGSWRGGSILSSLSSFKKMWMTKEEYQEYGYFIVQRKCF